VSKQQLEVPSKRQNEMQKMQFCCSLCIFPAEMAGGSTGVIRRIDTFAWRLARLMSLSAAIGSRMSAAAFCAICAWRMEGRKPPKMQKRKIFNTKAQWLKGTERRLNRRGAEDAEEDEE
jgi:hypothetical protein